MVNNVRLILETPAPIPFPDGDARKTVGPIYDLLVVQQIVSGDIIFTATDDVEKNLEDLQWDVDDVALVIKSLQKNDYKESEWCLARNGVKIDADAYVVPYDYIEESRAIGNVRYYVKFGFRSNKLILRLISCHVS